MLGILRLLVVMGGIAGGVLFFVKNVLGQGQWRKGINGKHFKLLQESLHKKSTALVELDDEELKLLSFDQKKGTLRNGSFKFLSGVFHSIYSEPLLDYAQMVYDKFNALIIVRTTEQEFVYRVGRNSTDIYVNGNLLGNLNSSGKLLKPTSTEILAELDTTKEARLQSLKKAGREIASLLNPMADASPNGRAIQFLEHKNDQERIILMALTFLNLIQRS